MSTLQQDEDVFDDPDLLDFEEPNRRAVLAVKMRGGRMPATVSTARIIMFTQPLLPIVVPIVASIVRNNGATAEEAEIAPTTTTTIAAEAGQQAQQGGNAGLFLVVALGMIAMVVGLMVLGVRLKRMTPAARSAALAGELFLLVIGIGLLTRGFAPLYVALTLSAAAVVALLLAPATKKGLAEATVTDTSVRFDILNLPELDK